MNKKSNIKKSDLSALLEKIGGEKQLKRILEDFYGRMAKDQMIGFFFHRKDLKKIALQQKNFLLRAMGATHSYSGKAPALAHRQMPPILQGHFDRRLKLLQETLKDHGLSDAEIQIWITFENAFRQAIVS